MNGNSLFLDTNIVLYLLDGDETVADILFEKTVFISFISELELLGFKGLTQIDHERIVRFLMDATIVDINSEIKKITIELRKTYKIKLPDAIVAATSFYLNLPFLTSDKELSTITELNVLLYNR